MAYLRISDFKTDNRTDSDAFDAMLAAAGSEPSCFDLAGHHTINRPIKYQPGRHLFNGQNATIVCRDLQGKPDRTFNAFEPLIGKGLSVSEMLKNMSDLTFKDMFIVNGRNAIVTNGTTKTLYENINFQSNVRAIHHIFGMNYRIIGCQVSNNHLEGFLLRSGLSDNVVNGGHEDEQAWFTDATASNSQSNVGVIENCKIFSTAGQLSGIRLDASANADIRTCIFEGANPKYDIYMDGRGSTTASSIMMKNLHIEHGCTNAHIYATGYRQITVEEMFKQKASSGFTIDANIPKVFVKKTSNTPGSSKLWKAHPTKSVWIFEDCHMSYSQATSSQAWVDRPRSITFKHQGTTRGIGDGAGRLGNKEGGYIGEKGQDIQIDSRREFSDRITVDLNKGKDLNNYELVGVKQAHVRKAGGGYAFVDIPLIVPKK